MKTEVSLCEELTDGLYIIDMNYSLKDGLYCKLCRLSSGELALGKLLKYVDHFRSSVHCTFFL